MSVQANTGPRWENKSSLAFWRGRDSRQERLDLVRMSHRHPDVIDARLTRMFFFKHTPDLGETVDPVSFFDFFKVNYIRLLKLLMLQYSQPLVFRVILCFMYYGICLSVLFFALFLFSALVANKRTHLRTALVAAVSSQLTALFPVVVERQFPCRQQSPLWGSSSPLQPLANETCFTWPDGWFS